MNYTLIFCFGIKKIILIMVSVLISINRLQRWITLEVGTGRLIRPGGSGSIFDWLITNPYNRINPPSRVDPAGHGSTERDPD